MGLGNSPTSEITSLLLGNWNVGSEVPLPVRTANADTVTRVRPTGDWEGNIEVAYVNGKRALETFCQDGQECIHVLCMWRGEETSLNGLA